MNDFKRYQGVFVVVAILALAGCVSPQVNALAERGEWFELGKEDALNGLQQRNLDRLDAAYDAADAKDYAAGYTEGRDSYCQMDNAVMLGRLGKPYMGICSGLSHGWSFEQEYNRGRDAYLGR
uniref:DUF2799 domain-containing protein n=1 Tax=Thaumasiovibrio occultus TaxID=1891184 RepID=UPI000B34C047|nr:DUF2799 domain-containing protein [Thaumasiovibrio occultus]